MRSSLAPPRDPGELRLISDLAYEIKMWSGTRTALDADLARASDDEFLVEIAQNALLESFTVHTRSLHEFLYEPRRYPNDVRAEDFFPRAQWGAMVAGSQTPMGTLPLRNMRVYANRPALAESRSRIGKEIAHLSYARMGKQVADKLWPTDQIFHALGTDLARFVEQVPTEHVYDRFRAIARLLPGPDDYATTGVKPPVATSNPDLPR